MNKAGMMISDLYKSYVLRNAIHDASRFLRKNLKNVDWDRNYWLHKAGLTTYRPARATVSGISLFVLGVLAGGAAALAFAPKAGPELRRDVKSRAQDIISRANTKVSAETPALA